MGSGLGLWGEEGLVVGRGVAPLCGDDLGAALILDAAHLVRVGVRGRVGVRVGVGVRLLR